MTLKKIRFACWLFKTRLEFWMLRFTKRFA